MKILAEAKKDFQVEKEIEVIKEVERQRQKGSMAEGMCLSMSEIFVTLGDKFQDVTFILSDNAENIVGWRN